jgi:hypothetical protein
MKGLELSERYFLECGLPMIQSEFPLYEKRMAAGLVGDGSECLGYDDEISRDHDWGPGFCIWLSGQDHDIIGKRLQEEYDQLPREFLGYKILESEWGGGRVGIFETGKFYRKFIGFNRVPASLSEWRILPESYLAAATNGRVFVDNLGEFTAIRKGLLEFYPEDIRLKKIASRCMTIAREGQYNYGRCIRRKEYVAAQYAEFLFIGDAISIVFLFNKRYKPFYKWMHRALGELPILGKATAESIYAMSVMHETESGAALYRKKEETIESICQSLIAELKKQGLSSSDSSFLLDHGPQVHQNIKDKELLNTNVWVE